MDRGGARRRHVRSRERLLRTKCPQYPHHLGDRDQSLNDYANRTWAGLVATYYKPRWELFCDAVLEAVESDEPFDEAAFTERCKDFEWAWVNSTDKNGLNAEHSAVKPVAGMLYAKYKSQIE